jgi:hypothetical protein
MSDMLSPSCRSCISCQTSSIIPSFCRPSFCEISRKGVSEHIRKKGVSVDIRTFGFFQALPFKSLKRFLLRRGFGGQVAR